MKILDDFLEYVGVKGFDELTEEEQKTYALWTEVLSKPSLTIADIITFLDAEDSRLQDVLLDYDLSEKKRIFTQATSRLVRNLTAILTAQEKEKSHLQAQIEQKLKRS